MGLRALTGTLKLRCTMAMNWYFGRLSAPFLPPVSLQTVGLLHLWSSPSATYDSVLLLPLCISADWIEA